MVNSKGFLLLIIVIALFSTTNIVKVVAEGRISSARLNQILKRADSNTNYASRQKRYTDFQEQASAVCTGLCMYMEEKSYVDCFDICNY